jgi:hypothetical protein
MIAGGMAEWSMAVVLKTTKVQAFGGSNPSPSATFRIPSCQRGYHVNGESLANSRYADGNRDGNRG